ncbi:ribonuclease HI [Vibrio harveyi]|uniref:ribonuclease HI n=1 Tax=Vibrio harveyi TaxID=669 RepID=UPI003CEBA560
MKKATITEIRDSYKEGKQEKDNIRHNILEAEFGKLGQTVEIFTDGSSKGSSYTSDGRSFAGWGWVKKMKGLNGKVHKNYRYGGLTNATATEAELTAIGEALDSILRPSNVNLFTDSISTLKFLKSHEEVKKTIDDFRAEVREYGPKRISSDRWIEFREAQAADKVHHIIKNNDNVLSVDLEWVRSHVLEGLGAQAVDFSTCETPDDYSLANKVTGNYEADYIANKGAIKGIVSSLAYFKTSFRDQNKAMELYGLVKKNFASSQFAREVLLGYLSKKGVMDFNNERLENAFGMDFIRLAASAREIYLSGDKEAYDKFITDNTSGHSQKYVEQLDLAGAEKPPMEMVNVTSASREQRAERLDKFKSKFGSFGLSR